MQLSQLEIYITRLKRYFKNLDRVGKTWYVLILCAIILIFSLFKFSILNHEFYTNLANYYQKTTVKNSISRGTITSSEDSLKGTVAVSTNLGTLAIDPTQTGSTTKLLDMLTSAVMNEFCSRDTREGCTKSIAAYTRNDTFLSGSTATDDELKNRVSSYIENRMKSPVESVSLAENLKDDTITAINNLNNKALFWASNNLYVNPTLVENPNDLAGRLAPHI